MNLGLIKTGLSIVGRVTGVLPVEASGEPVKARKGRLVALLVVLGSSIGMDCLSPSHRRLQTYW